MVETAGTGREHGEGEEPPADFARIAEQWRPPVSGDEQRVVSGPAAALAGLFNQPSPVRVDGDPLPPLWHWAHFVNRAPQSALGTDGHLADGEFVPPLPRRRRMFGGGSVRVYEPLRCGDLVQRQGQVDQVRVRKGRSGWLLLVTVREEFFVQGQLRVREQQQLVYRQAKDVVSQAATPPAAETSEPNGDWVLEFEPDERLLFRFSALTYNAHRIHYDRDYATRVEGYPGLVVHGPLLAIAALELPRRHLPQPVTAFDYRLRAPLFEGGTVRVEGRLADDAIDLSAGRPGAAHALTGQAWSGPMPPGEE